MEFTEKHSLKEYPEKERLVYLTALASTAGIAKETPAEKNEVFS